MHGIQEGVIADYRDNAEMELPRLMYSYELKRVRYLLQAYLRTRLKKIEKFVLHILENEQVLLRLSEKEQTYSQVVTSYAMALYYVLQPAVLLPGRHVSWGANHLSISCFVHLPSCLMYAVQVFKDWLPRM